MYEPPKLNRVGTAQDIILGMISTGYDLDTLFFVGEFEYADDADVASSPAKS